MTSVTSDDSHDGGYGRPAGVKNRACPFCLHSFTSSSLGRHLDLYIKDKNPKNSDGIHDVDKIRQMRGRITRRNPKGSGANSTSRQSPRSASSPSSGQAQDPAQLDSARAKPQVTKQHEGKSYSPPAMAQTLPHGPAYGTPRLAWHATGVINDLPPHPATGPQQGLPQQPPFSALNHDPGPTLGTVPPPQSAAEAALRDVLDNIQQASVRLHGPDPYDFNVFEQNFPTLCLRLLATPSPLFSATPYASQDSWPIEYPSAQHVDKIKQSVRRRLKVYMQMCSPTNSRFCTSREEYEAKIARELDDTFVRYSNHIDCTFEQWEPLSTAEKQRVWSLEVMRAYAAGVKEQEKLDKRLSNAHVVIEGLRAEVQHSRAMQSPAAWQTGIVPPNRAPRVTNSLARELITNDSLSNAWNFQSVMDKYSGTNPSATYQ